MGTTGKQGKTQGTEDDADAKETNTRDMNTVPNPPSFFYNDIEKWNAKFAKHIKEREYVKRMLAQTQEITCLTRNTNIKEGDEPAKKDHAKSSSVDERATKAG